MTDLCVATVTDEAFLPGTLVLLSSFVLHNPWFRDRIVVIHDGLSDAARAALARVPGVEFRVVSPALQERVASVIAARPQLARKRPIFYSIEAFAVTGAQRVLKLDGDILCRGDAAALFELDGALRCAPDVAHHRNQVRDLESYAAADRAEVDSRSEKFATTFNAGVMLLTPSVLAGAYDELLDRLRPETWSGVVTGHSDSVLLNRVFRGRWSPLPEPYNYFVTPNSHRWDRPPLSAAVFLHYLGNPKPWQIAPGENDPAWGPEQRSAFALWWEARAALAL